MPFCLRRVRKLATLRPLQTPGSRDYVARVQLNHSQNLRNLDHRPILRQIILCWLARLTDDDLVPIDNLPGKYAILQTTQDTIREDSMMFGYFLKKWVYLQNRYLVALELPHCRIQAASGIKAVMIQLLEQCHTRWLLRNSHLYGTDPNNTCSYKHLHLLAQVTELYAASPFMLAADRDIFEIPLESRQGQPKSTLQVFYSWAKPVIKLSVAKAAEMGADFRSN
jgi:hypothetical protein